MAPKKTDYLALALQSGILKLNECGGLSPVALVEKIRILSRKIELEERRQHGFVKQASNLPK